MPSAPYTKEPLTEDEMLDAFLDGWPDKISEYATQESIWHFQAAAELLEGYIVLQNKDVGEHTYEIARHCYTLRARAAMLEAPGAL